MNIINELEALKDEVLTIHDTADKVKARGHINEIIKGLKETEKGRFEVPEWVTIQAKDIGAES